MGRFKITLCMNIFFNWQLFPISYSFISNGSWQQFNDIHNILSCLSVRQASAERQQESGVVSLTFCELSKIISRKYTMPEITFMGRISCWKLCTHVCQSMTLGTSTKLQLEIFMKSTIHKFGENTLKGLWNDSETTPWPPLHHVHTVSLVTLDHLSSA